MARLWLVILLAGLLLPQLARAASDWEELLRAGSRLMEAGRLDEAEAVLGRALKAVGGGELALRRKALTLNDLGILAARAGRLEEAYARLDEARKILEALGAGARSRLVAVLVNLGEVLRRLGRLEEAEARLVRALELGERSGADHPGTQQARLALALVLERRGEAERASELAATAVQAFTRTLGAVHPRTLDARRTLARLLRSQGREEEAIAVLREAALADDLPAEPAVPLLADLAHLLRRSGALEEAVEVLRRARQLQLAAAGADHPRSRRLANDLGVLLKERGALAEARRLLEEAVGAPDHPERPLYLANLAAVLAALGEYEAAGARLDAALELLQADSEPDPLLLARVRNDRAVVLFALGSWQEALAESDAALAAAERALGAADPALLPYLGTRRALLEALDQGEQVRAVDRRMAALRERLVDRVAPAAGP